MAREEILGRGGGGKWEGKSGVVREEVREGSKGE